MQYRGENVEQKIRRNRNMGGNLRRLRDDASLSQEKLCAELQRRGSRFHGSQSVTFFSDMAKLLGNLKDNQQIH